MAKLKPWFRVVEPRQDLKEGRPLDASEFAVHLDKVRSGNAPPDYTKPDQFFERTYLTKGLTDLAAEVLRRLSGERTQTSAVFNMATQFGGGKTHSLTLLYHLAKAGKKAGKWRDVPKILDRAGLKAVPDNCAVAVFVGTEFDSLKGRGGTDGTPLRKTPWGEIAFQLGGRDAFARVEEHDAKFIDPKGDVIQTFIPKDRPCLILMDEIINYVSTYRSVGHHNRLYNFLQCLSQTVSGMDNVVLVVAIPASELSYTQDDIADQQRFQHMLDRLGKAVLISAESDSAEIIRRRLIDCDGFGIGEDGRVVLPPDAVAACREWADWVVDNKDQMPQWFPFDHAREVFQAAYPFHPAVLSVFERKWQGLERFQRTRGVLRLLALWLSRAYVAGTRGQNKDAIIGLGTAPLDDPVFRAAVLEQLGEGKLEGVVTTDIEGRVDSNAVGLDQEAPDAMKESRLHKKTATVVFFESNGGQSKSKNSASVTEIRLGAAEPDTDIGNIETTLDALVDGCYYLSVERNLYRFGLKENLNKRFADRRRSVRPEDVVNTTREHVEKAFPPVDGTERKFFVEASAEVADRPVVTFAVISPEHSVADEPDFRKKVEAMTVECGTTSRTYKSAIFWLVPDSSAQMYEEARRLLAWLDIEAEGLELDATQQSQLNENIGRARRDLRLAICRSYRTVLFLAKDNSLDTLDLGLYTTGAADKDNMTKYVLNELMRKDVVGDSFPARKLVKQWPPAFAVWSTKAVRDVFYASPLFPRLLNGNAIRETIARGVNDGLLAYVSKSDDGGIGMMVYKRGIDPTEIEISDDMFIITADEAEKNIKPPELVGIVVLPGSAVVPPGGKQTFIAKGSDQFGREMPLGKVEWSCPAAAGRIDANGQFAAGSKEGSFTVTAKASKLTGAAGVTVSKTDRLPEHEPGGRATKLSWSGEVPPQKWMNFYTKVLTRYVRDGDLKINVSFEASPAGGVSEQQAEEAKAALRELGLGDGVGKG